jgi:hypothetical protein
MSASREDIKNERTSSKTLPTKTGKKPEEILKILIPVYIQYCSPTIVRAIKMEKN